MIMLLTLFALSNLFYLFPPERSDHYLITLIIFLILQSIFWIPLHRQSQQGFFSNPATKWLLFGLVFLVGLFAQLHFPAFENDYHRYFWDGQQCRFGESPYRFSPAEAPLPEQLDSDLKTKLEQFRETVGYPDKKSIYGPVTQLIFCALTFPANHSPPLFQFLLTTLGLIAFFFSCRCFFRESGFAFPTENSLLLMLHPLLVYEWIHARHFDVWTAAILLQVLRPGGLNNWFFSFPVALFSRVTSVFLISTMPYQLRPRAVVAFLFWVSLPMALLGFDYIRNVFQFSQIWEMNSGAFRLIRNLFPEGVDRFWISITALSLFAILHMLVLVWRGRGKGTFVWVHVIFLAFSPVMNPWYFSWILPVAVTLTPREKWTYLTIICSLPLSMTFYLETQSPLPFWNIEHSLIWLGLLFLTLGPVYQWSRAPKNTWN